jgi:hypothetical protein
MLPSPLKVQFHDRQIENDCSGNRDRDYAAYLHHPECKAVTRVAVKATGDFPTMDTWKVALIAREAGDHRPLNPPHLSAVIAAMADEIDMEE